MFSLCLFSIVQIRVLSLPEEGRPTWSEANFRELRILLKDSSMVIIYTDSHCIHVQIICFCKKAEPISDPLATSGAGIAPPPLAPFRPSLCPRAEHEQVVERSDCGETARRERVAGMRRVNVPNSNPLNFTILDEFSRRFPDFQSRDDFSILRWLLFWLRLQD